MRKLFYLGFCLVLAMGVGCAITDYPLITDNNQRSNGGGNQQGVGYTVNTAGKAHIVEGSQIATLWPDGADELIWFVDQDAKGNQTLYTYDNFSSSYPIFHGDIYCNPDKSGCAVTTANNPFVGDVDPFDYSGNPQCAGWRSLSLLVSASRYYGECGRARMTAEDKVRLLNYGKAGQSLNGLDGLFYNLDHNNTSIVVDTNNGYRGQLPMNATMSLFVATGPGHLGTIDQTHPMLRSTISEYARVLDAYPSHHNTVTLSYNGISMSFDLRGGDSSLTSSSKVLNFMNSKY